MRPWVFPRGTAPGASWAVLFDRDGTLVEDVPYNADPARVRPLPGAREAVAAARAAGAAVGVVTNQSGVARGLITPRGEAAVRRRIDALLGPFDVWAVCPHGPGDGCGCRKPAPGLVLAACARLGVAPERAVVVGDIAADLGAARAAGAHGVLVPTPVTRPEEIAAARAAGAWAPDAPAAVALARSGPAGSGPAPVPGHGCGGAERVRPGDVPPAARRPGPDADPDPGPREECGV
jgi:HAD superfamily hydrolase (TIGR01662 family)